MTSRNPLPSARPDANLKQGQESDAKGVASENHVIEPHTTVLSTPWAMQRCNMHVEDAVNEVVKKQTDKPKVIRTPAPGCHAPLDKQHECQNRRKTWH